MSKVYITVPTPHKSTFSLHVFGEKSSYEYFIDSYISGAVYNGVPVLVNNEYVYFMVSLGLSSGSSIFKSSMVSMIYYIELLRGLSNSLPLRFFLKSIHY